MSRGNNRSHLREFLQEFSPRETLRTATAVLVNHKKFFEEVLQGDYKDKVHPIPFFLSCLSALLLVMALITPDPTWYEVHGRLDAEEVEEFWEAFDEPQVASTENFGDSASYLETFIDFYRGRPYLDSVLRRKLKIYDADSPVTVEHIKTYLDEHEYDYEHLTRRIIEINQELKDEQNFGGPFHDILMTFLIILFFFFFFRLSHRFLQPHPRTQQQTIDVWIYFSGTAVLLNLITFPLYHAPSLKYLYWWINIPLLVGMYTKCASIFHYTHNVGFWRWLWALMRAYLLMLIWFIVPILLLVLLAFGLPYLASILDASE